MQILSFPLGPLETNCYFLSKGSQAIVIDPGGDPTPLLQWLKKNALTLTHIFNTHLHLDHTYGNAALAAATGAKIYAGEGEKIIEQTELAQGGLFGLPPVPAYTWEAIAPGEHKILNSPCQILSTPGHSPGSISLYFSNAQACFVGDLIFKGSVGRTDFPGCSNKDLKESINYQIFTLPDETTLYPGHGPSTTVLREKKGNPYV